MYLRDNISQLLLNLLLSPLETLPQVVTHTALKQQCATGLLGGFEMDQAIDIFDCASKKRCLEDGIGDLGGLFIALFRIHVQKGEVDVALQIGREPGGEVGALSCLRAVSRNGFRGFFISGQFS